GRLRGPGRHNSSQLHPSARFAARARCHRASYRRAIDDQIRAAPRGDRPGADRGSDWGSDHRDEGKSIEMKLQEPNTKRQRRSNNQAPKALRHLWLGIWSLDLLWMLDVEVWIFRSPLL